MPGISSWGARAGAVIVLACAAAATTACAGSATGIVSDGARPSARVATDVGGLVELFDAARLFGDGAARARLLDALGLPADARGETATRAVVSALRDRTDGPLRALLDDDLAELDGDADPSALAAHRRAVAGLPRFASPPPVAAHTGAGSPVAAHTVASPPVAAHTVVGSPVAAHTVASPPVAASSAAATDGAAHPALRVDAEAAAVGHALVALHASCARALADAAVAPPSLRARIALHCLLPLGVPAPERWTVDDPERRPPDPRWSTFFDGLARLLDEIRARAPRLLTLADRLAAADARLAAEIARDGREPPDVAALRPRLPVGDPALPRYDRAPWVIVEDELVTVGPARYGLRDHELARRLERTLDGDPARRLTLFVLDGATASADAVDTLGELARRHHAVAIDLALRAGDAAVVLPLELPGAAGRDRPRGVLETRAAFTLLVRPEGPLLHADDGELALRDADLERRLDDLRAAFPDEPLLSLAVDPLASHAAVVRAALLARRRFRRVALAPVPRRATSSEFATRLARRAAARVTVESPPGTPLPGAGHLRGCYVDALDRAPTLAATITTTRPLDAQLPDAVLARCLAERIPSLPARGPVTITLTPR